MSLEKLKQELKTLAYNKEDYRAINKFRVDKYTVITSVIYDEDGRDVAFAIFDKSVDEKKINLEFIEKSAVAFFKLCAENYFVNYFVRDEKVFDVLTKEKIYELARKSIEIVEEREKKLEEIGKKYKEILKKFAWELAIAVEKKLNEKYNIKVVSLYDDEIIFLIDKYLGDIIVDVEQLINYLAKRVYKIIRGVLFFAKEEDLRKATYYFDVVQPRLYKYLKVEARFFEEKIKYEDITSLLEKVKYSNIYISFDIENEKVKISVYSDMLDNENDFREYEYDISIKNKENDKLIMRLATDKSYVAKVIEELSKLYNLGNAAKIDEVVAYLCETDY